MKDIPNPKMELVTHVTYKSVQLCSFVGAAIVAPIVNTLKGIKKI